MVEQNGQEQSSKAPWVVPLVALAIIVVLAIVWRILYTPAQQAVTVQPKHEVNEVTLQTAIQTPPVIESKEKASEPIITAQVTIDDVIKIRQHWDPAFTEWVGKQSPDFDLADITGANHKLSSYKGKNVMLIFWATWCGPCRMEIPGLIELRKKISPEKLAMVAISYEKGDAVRSFFSQIPVNYTVIATPQYVMPSPFAMVDVIPATFFIDKDGIIRLATVGVVLPTEVEMILKAMS